MLVRETYEIRYIHPNDSFLVIVHMEPVGEISLSMPRKADRRPDEQIGFLRATAHHRLVLLGDYSVNVAEDTEGSLQSLKLLKGDDELFWVGQATLSFAVMESLAVRCLEDRELRKTIFAIHDGFLPSGEFNVGVATKAMCRAVAARVKGDLATFREKAEFASTQLRHEHILDLIERATQWIREHPIQELSTLETGKRTE